MTLENAAIVLRETVDEADRGPVPLLLRYRVTNEWPVVWCEEKASQSNAVKEMMLTPSDYNEQPEEGTLFCARDARELP